MLRTSCFGSPLVCGRRRTLNEDSSTCHKPQRSEILQAAGGQRLHRRGSETPERSQHPLVAPADWLCGPGASAVQHHGAQQRPAPGLNQAHRVLLLFAWVQPFTELSYW